LGQGSTADIFTSLHSISAVQLGDGRYAQKIVAGASHTCALLDDGSVKCWGYNKFGQLGIGSTLDIGDGANEMGNSLQAVDLGTGRTAKDISTTEHHTCALLDNNSIKCWGRGLFGRLGKGHPNDVGSGPSQMGDNLRAVDLGFLADWSVNSISARSARNKPYNL
jgi:alpha-tubulin suppressor-like RCC1 family protein